MERGGGGGLAKLGTIVQGSENTDLDQYKKKHQYLTHEPTDTGKLLQENEFQTFLFELEEELVRLVSPPRLLDLASKPIVFPLPHLLQ